MKICLIYFSEKTRTELKTIIKFVAIKNLRTILMHNIILFGSEPPKNVQLIVLDKE